MAVRTRDEELSVLGGLLDAIGLDKDSFEVALSSLIDSFFAAEAGRKLLYERLRRLPSPKMNIPPVVLARLETDDKILIVSEIPLRVLITPVGLWEYYSLTHPSMRLPLAEKTIAALGSQGEKRLRKILGAFSGAPLTWKEMGAVVFLAYNDSTAPERGRYYRTLELWTAIDRIVQAFVQNDAEARPTPHLDGAPGRWYLGEANRKLGNAISVKSGSYYVRPRELGRVLKALKDSIQKQEPAAAMGRYRAFVKAFSRERSVLAREGVLFANEDSISRVARLFERSGAGADNSSSR